MSNCILSLLIITIVITAAIMAHRNNFGADE